MLDSSYYNGRFSVAMFDYRMVWDEGLFSTRIHPAISWSPTERYQGNFTVFDSRVKDSDLQRCLFVYWQLLEPTVGTPKVGIQPTGKT